MTIYLFFFIFVELSFIVGLLPETSHMNNYTSTGCG